MTRSSQGHHLIANLFEKLKCYRAIAIRYDKAEPLSSALSISR